MKIDDFIPKEEVISGNTALEVERCTSDYRQAKEDSLLFLLPGVSFDTYSIADKYASAKPRAIVSERTDCFVKTKVPVIRVKSARRAFAYANYKASGLQTSKMRFIGVTGTNGKTSTATMIRRVLEDNGERVAFFGTGKIEYEDECFSDKNYSMTTPDPDILYPMLRKMEDRGATVAVMEVSSHALFLEKLAPITFDVGVFTGLSHEHLDFHKNMENYLAAKEKLIANAKKGIINLDDKSGRYLYERYREKSVGIGVIYDADLRAIEINNKGFDGLSYILRAPNHTTKITLAIPGIYNVYNSLLCFAALREFNITPKSIKDSLASIKAIDGRFEIIKRGDLSVIIDYAHTPAALDSLLKNINTDKNIKQNIILVFGCGGDRDQEKRPKMAQIAKKYASKTIVTTDNSRSESPEKIINDIVSGFGGGGYGVILDRAEAIRYAICKADKNDIVVIAGKGHERYIQDANGFHDFDERKIIEQALNERDEMVL